MLSLLKHDGLYLFRIRIYEQTPDMQASGICSGQQHFPSAVTSGIVKEHVFQSVKVGEFTMQ